MIRAVDEAKPGNHQTQAVQERASRYQQLQAHANEWGTHSRSSPWRDRAWLGSCSKPHLPPIDPMMIREGQAEDVERRCYSEEASFH
jgi:hypothetical protein